MLSGREPCRGYEPRCSSEGLNPLSGEPAEAYGKRHLPRVLQDEHKLSDEASEDILREEG